MTRTVPSLFAHLQRFSPASPAKNPCPCSTKAMSLCPSRKLTLPSAFVRFRYPFFHRFRRLKDVGLSFRSLLPRVWLPSRGCQHLHPWKPFSASNALGFRPSELFSTVGSKRKFPFSSFVLALFSKTFSAFGRRSDDLIPNNSFTPSSLPEGLAQVGALALLGFSDLAGSLSLSVAEESISLSSFPLSTFLPLHFHK